MPQPVSQRCWPASDSHVEPTGSQRRGAVLSRRPAAQDDHVIVAHVGSAVPSCSAIMYAAYLPGQGRVGRADPLLVLTVRCLGAPQRHSQVRRGCERRLSGVDPAGQRVMTSSNSQLLPSGSLTVANEP